MRRNIRKCHLLRYYGDRCMLKIDKTNCINNKSLLAAILQEHYKI